MVHLLKRHQHRILGQYKSGSTAPSLKSVTTHRVLIREVLTGMDIFITALMLRPKANSLASQLT